MKPRILIVDDEATIRASLLESLIAEGYEVEEAETGEAALACVCRESRAWRSCRPCATRATPRR